MSNALRHFLEVTVHTLECPTSPGEQTFICPGCGIKLGLHYGQRGGRWFIAHEPAAGRCKWSACTWRSTDKEECIRYFHQQTGSPEPDDCSAYLAAKNQ